MFPSIFFRLTCRGHVKNVFNVLCLPWNSLATIDSWRDSFSLRGVSSESFGDVTITGDHGSKESSSGRRTQPLTASCSWKTCRMVRTLKIHVFPVFFVPFLCSSPYHEVSGGEGGCPTLKVKGLFLWIWWIKPRIWSHSSSLPPFIPSYFWLHSPPLSSLSPSQYRVFQWILQRRY